MAMSSFLALLKNRPHKSLKQSCKCQLPRNKEKCETPTHNAQERAAKPREGKWQPGAEWVPSLAALIQQEKEVTQKEKFTCIESDKITTSYRIMPLNVANEQSVQQPSTKSVKRIFIQ